MVVGCAMISSVQSLASITAAADNEPWLLLSFAPMSLVDDDRPRKPAPAQPGESLADLSIEELRARIDLYREEIGRLERDIEAKERHRQAAESVFRR
jgi:uncharacterized small protein (DUF1192 family)